MQPTAENLDAGIISDPAGEPMEPEPERSYVSWSVQEAVTEQKLVEAAGVDPASELLLEAANPHQAQQSCRPAQCEKPAPWTTQSSVSEGVPPFAGGAQVPAVEWSCTDVHNQMQPAPVELTTTTGTGLPESPSRGLQEAMEAQEAQLFRDLLHQHGLQKCESPLVRKGFNSVGKLASLTQDAVQGVGIGKDDAMRLQQTVGAWQRTEENIASMQREIENMVRMICPRLSHRTSTCLHCSV